MTFNSNKAIYLQIAESITDDILAGKLTPNNRVPSIRDLSAQFQVNVNTVTRALEHLQHSEVVYNQRGIGFFVAENAPSTILESRRHNFMNNELPSICHQMKLMNITAEEFLNIFNQIK